MNLYKKKEKLFIELDRHEASCLFTIVGHVAAGSNKVEKVSYELFMLLNAESLIPVTKAKHTDCGKYWEGLTFPDGVIKKNCSFFYPKSAYRNRESNNIEHFEPRTLKEAYIEDDYLIGLDKTIKKFTLSKVKHLTWE